MSFQLFENSDKPIGPVIGKIFTKELEFQITDGRTIKLPPEELDVVSIIDDKAGKVYVINKWYKPGVPQLVHDKMVKRYEAL